jgi:hypothetical protein
MPDRYWSSDMDAELFDPRTAFAELGRIMLGAQDLNPTLQRIADLARKTIPEIDEVSVTLVDGGQPKTVVFTGQLAVHLDERQYETANGPVPGCGRQRANHRHRHQRRRHRISGVRLGSPAPRRHPCLVDRVACPAAGRWRPQPLRVHY